MNFCEDIFIQIQMGIKLKSLKIPNAQVTESFKQNMRSLIQKGPDKSIHIQ